MPQLLGETGTAAQRQRECTFGSEEKQPEEHKAETTIWLICSTEEEKMIA